MPTLYDYIATMDAADVESPTGDGFAVFPLCTGTGTATCGVVGLATLPAMTADGAADWAPIGLATLPAMTAMGTTDDYRPAWGDPALPALTAEGTAHVLIESVSLLPPLYATGSTGAVGAATMPSMTSYGLDDGFNRTASGAAALPALTAEAYVCGIESAINTAATSAAVVALLQQGNTTIAEAAAAACAGYSTPDVKALALVRYVSNLLTYTSDSTSGIGDRWTCALPTLQRRYGDCEDGAILLHSLMLAAGIDPGRIRTAMGTVMTAALVTAGHAWVMYRRTTDEEWIPLEWTAQPTPYTVPISSINRQVDRAADYTAISYILTDEAFYQVADANYIANLAANRSTGAATLPALAGTGTVGLSAWAALTLPAATATGTCGARASASLPALAATGTAKEAATARGEAVMPALDATGATGATGAMTISALKTVGTCGTSASGSANFPALTVDAFAWVENTTWGDVDFPALTATGRAVQGRVASGVGILPALRSTGRATQGPIARGVAIFPRLRATGVASPLLTAMGDVELPPLAGRGHAVSAVSWTGILSYDATRLA